MRIEKNPSVYRIEERKEEKSLETKSVISRCKESRKEAIAMKHIEVYF